MLACPAAISAPPANAAAEVVEHPVVVLPGLTALRAMAAQHGVVRLQGVSLRPGTNCDLELEPFSVTTPATRFVVGHIAGGDQACGFDPQGVLLLRGSVTGEPGSHVFLAVSEWGSFGRVERNGAHDVLAAGPGGAGQAISMRVIEDGPVGGAYPGMPFCAVNTADSPGGARVPVGGPPPAPTIRQIQMALETDYELFSIFGNPNATNAYLVSMWGAVSDVYLRDVNTRIVLTFVRLWNTPDDLFNEEDPLPEFVDYWQANMGAVPRDAAQFCSGRRNVPYGGVAYLNALCGDFAYSVVGYLIGKFETDVPSPFGYDVMVCAHELGHNCGSLHSHDYGLDNCINLFGPPQRGSIMSYCSQTRSGANLNIDLRFHVVEQGEMESYMAADAPCLAADCNGNGADDAADIAGGGSSDANGDGVPDECQDCNGNGTLDPLDIGGGQSDDVNANGIPDECEPDCNGNGVPDEHDIALGAASDLYGNNVPDSCETDCDGSGTSDYTQIRANMSLDVDRNTLLDACQDCDGDGTSDMVELAGANNAWVASTESGSPLRQFHAISGVRVAQSTGNTLLAPQDLIITANGRVLVSSSGDNRVAEFTAGGTFVGNLVTPGLGSLSFPTGMVISPDGALLVASRNNNRVNKYNLNTGAFLGTFVAAGSGGLSNPWGLAYGPNGNLFVTSLPPKVIQYNGTTGALVGTFVPTAGNGGMQDPHGLLFKPNGNLLVASTNTNQILEFNGANGAFIGQFNHGGTATVLTLDQPWTLRLGRDGEVYASRHQVSASPPAGGGKMTDQEDDSDIVWLHINSTRIYIYDVNTGNFVRSLVTGHDTQLSFPSGFDFLPAGADCNFNQLPDNCDIASGFSDDIDQNGIPDECLPPCLGDINHSGAVTILDFLALLAAWGPNPGNLADLNGDGTVDILDFLTLLANWGPC
jgi:WD40 repeat protein